MDFLSRHKRAFIAIVIIVCVISTIATINYRFRPNFLDNALGYIITPIQSLSMNVTDWFSETFSSSGSAEEIEAENAKLKQEVSILETENKRLKLAEDENKKLSKLLELEEKYPMYPMVGAEIIARDPSNWFNSFYINKGTNDGLTKDMVVLADGGLVGHITKAGPTYCEVTPFMNINSSDAVSVKTLRTEDVGIVKGDVSLMTDGLCRMEYISLDADIVEGDELVTSQLSEIYPPGITVGYVKEVGVDTEGLAKYAIVEPAVDFKHMDTVMVINEVFESEITEEGKAVQ